MKVTKKKDHYLLENDHGSYHLSISQFEELGEEKAVKYAEREIRKKSQEYLDKDIDFKRARALGFCEYGIEDFCKKINIDINGTYKITDLKNKLTHDAILEYPNECLKLFGNSVLDVLGGPCEFLKNNKSRNALNFILSNYVTERDCHKLAIKFAFECISNFESVYPKDDRPRKAIEAKQKWLNGELSEDDLDAARSAAWFAASSAAESAALNCQINETLKVLSNEVPN